MENIDIEIFLSEIKKHPLISKLHTRKRQFHLYQLYVLYR